MPIKLMDLKYALRLLVKRPRLTLLTVLVLAGGLGISLYTFAALNTLIYGDLPIPDGGSIVRVGVGGWPNFEPLDAFELATIRAEAETLDELGLYRNSHALLGDPGASRNVRTVEADWRIFEFTRTAPLFGRGFVSDDSAPGAEPVAVLTHAAWQTEFSGDPDVVGRLVGVNGTATRIVGIMPDGYRFPMNAEMWLPLGPQALHPDGYTGMRFDAYARLAPGATVDAVEAELATLLERLRAQYADPAAQRDAESAPGIATVLSFQDASWGIFGTVVFGVLNMLAMAILLLAAVNVGNLLLARTNERIKEIGVRVALGAPRGRLIAQSTLENAMICAVGGVLAIAFAARALDATNGFMSALLGVNMPFWLRWTFDREVVAAAVLFLALTVIAVSTLPALCVGTVDPIALLRDGTRAGGLAPGRVSRVLLTVQVALISAVLVVGSAVAVIADRASSFQVGMPTADLVMMSIDLPAASYATTEQRVAYYERLLGELRGEAGIAAAAIMLELGITHVAADGAEYATPEDYPYATLAVMSESPSSIGPPLVAGRRFDDRDNAAGLKTAIVSEAFAAAHWPNESAIGRTVAVVVPEWARGSAADPAEEQRVVVGVVGDVNYDPLGMTRMGSEAVYLPLPQFVTQSTRVVVRHFGNEALASSAMYETAARLDPTVPPGEVVSYDAGLARVTLFSRTMTRLFAACGAFAILLAITGIYAMSSNAIVLRTHEIGLRRALGASNGTVVATFVRQGVRRLAVGLAVSAVVSALALLVIATGFSIQPGTLALIGVAVVVVISTAVLLSIYLAVRGVVRQEPSASLRRG